jgi:hypothetical protein
VRKSPDYCGINLGLVSFSGRSSSAAQCGCDLAFSQRAGRSEPRKPARFGNERTMPRANSAAGNPRRRVPQRRPGVAIAPGAGLR